jgi:diadenosine tetraphosphatase ApaH/serine/threonine PP2A family protein phosphatase
LRYAVLGDVHANLPALQAVLGDMSDRDIDRVLSVGDSVGYGANPCECLDLLEEHGTVAVAGNHDWAVLGKFSVEYFNSDARDSVEWTRKKLTRHHVERLDGLPLQREVDGIMLVHSNPFAPDYFDYIQTHYDVQLTFDHMRTHIGFVGHSHVPVMFANTMPVSCFLTQEYEVAEDTRLVVNVGSVGQPRDLDPRASYAIYDTDRGTVEMCRVEYDRVHAAEMIKEAGLPPTNAARLDMGR